jgi:lipid-binding SYLF domain-containing protein
MRKLFMQLLSLVLFALPAAHAWADVYDDATKVFLNAGESGAFFSKSYGYALFPSIGKGGVGIGGAYGKGHVYVKGKVVGDTSMTQLTAGLQLGGQAYSQIIFFEDERAFKEFTKGNFEFSAEASAVAITAAAGATGSTTGSSVGASGGKNDAKTVGKYYKGMATFTVAKGGLMYEASVGGQKFKFTPRKS